MRSGRLSFFAAAAWLVPPFLFLLMKPYIEQAVALERGSFIPGLGAAFTRLCVTAGFAFSLGLLSIIRRERLRWIGAIPCIVGGLILYWFATAILRERSRSGLPVIPGSLDLTSGILMALIGVFFLAYLLPKASSLLAREKEADDLGETGTEMKVKAFKVVGIAALLVGVALILVHLLDIF